MPKGNSYSLLTVGRVTATPTFDILMQGVVSISCAPSWCTLVDAPEDALTIVRKVLTLPLKRFVPRGRHWDPVEEKCFLRRPANRFPTGFMPKVAHALNTAGWQVKTSYSVPVPRLGAPYCLKLLGLDALHEHQGRGADLAENAVRARIEIGTSGGKTEVGAELARRINLPTLWTVNSATLADQTVARLKLRLGPHAVTVFSKGRVRDPNALICVSTVQALHRARKALTKQWWAHWRVVIADECQFATSKTWYASILRCSHAWFRYGLSGTVVTGKAERDWLLEGLTGRLLSIISVVGLAERDLAAMPEMRMLRAPASSFPPYPEVRKQICPRAHQLLEKAAALDWRDPEQQEEAKRLRFMARADLQKNGSRMWAQSYEIGIVKNTARNELFVRTAIEEHIAKGEKVLFLCTKIEHGFIIQDLFVERGVRVAWLSGSDSRAVRQQALKVFRTHKGGAALIASKIFNAGIDAPEIDAGFLIGSGGRTSPADSIQKVGRMVRWRPDKRTVPVYDGLDGVVPASTGEKDYLAAHTAARLAAYRKAGYPIRQHSAPPKR